MDSSHSTHCRHRWISRVAHRSFGSKRIAGLLLPLAGLGCLIWMLIRVIPKPSRAEYPCMKVAAPLAGGFVAYIAGMAIALFSLKKSVHLFKKNRSILATILVLCGVAVGTFTVLKTDTQSYSATLAVDSLFVPTDAPNTPVGVARGIFPGRVIWMWDSTAATWNGSGYWWSDAATHQDVVDSMLSKSLRSLTGKSSDAAAWDTLFKYFNLKHGKGNMGYLVGEKIAIKINLNQTSNAGNPGNASFTSPQSVLALLRQLVNKAGVQDSNITVYDLIRFVPDPIYTKCKNEFPNVHFMGWTASGGREKYIRDTTRVHWSEHLTLEKDASVSAKGGNPVYLPTTVTHAAYLINLASFKAHRYGGVTFGAKNHFGTLSCDDDLGNPYVYAPHAAGVHSYMAVHDFILQGSPEYSYIGRSMGSYNTLVDLMGHRDLGEKTLLFMVDALYGVQSEQDQVSTQSKWLSAPFNNDWTSSLFLSQDDVALESVGLDFFRTEQGMNKNILYVYGSVDNYLHEAAQANDPPSGTFYAPSGDGVRLQSLGVHEHWNNAVDKGYSRNLGTGIGIELLALSNSVTSTPEGSSPTIFTLHQNYPNPFNPSTTIAFSMLKSSKAELAVYDVNGKEVRVLVNGVLTAGNHSVRWNGSDDRGIAVSSGVYFYRLRTDNVMQSRKMLLVK
ncbi:MAG: DUF362 domain-containing protein [Bacteroidota bacterium]